LPQDSALLVAALNALFGALSMCVVYALLRARMGLGRLPALVGTALPAFSYGVWFYSICIEVYIIPLFFLLLTLYVLSGVCAGQAGGNTAVCGFALAGATHGLAVLFHQAHVLFAPVVLAAALVRYRRNIGAAARACLAYAAVAVPVVVLPYVAVMVFGEGIKTPEAAFRWLTAYAREGSFWHGLSAGTLLNVCVGTSKTLVGGQFVFALPWARELLHKALPEHGLTDETFLVRHITPAMAAGLTGLAVMFGLGFLSGLATTLARVRRLPKGAGVVLVLIAVWLVPYCAFFVFWEPSNVEMWIPQSVCGWLIFMMAWTAGRSDERRRITAMLALLAAVGFTTNYIGSIRPADDLNNDWYYSRVSSLQAARAGDIAVVPREWVWRGYVERYSAAQALPLTALRKNVKSDGEFARAVAGQIDDALAAGHSVFVLDEAVNPPPDMLHGSDLTPQVVQKLWDRYRDRWQQPAPDAAVYLIAGSTAEEQQGIKTSGPE